METRIIKAVFGASKSIVAPKRYKHDYGQEIEFVGIDLPNVFEAHFSNSKSGQAKKQIGQDNVVTVPDEYFVSGADVFCWVMVHDEATDGRTMYTVRIPVMERPEPINAEPTPVQQDVIEQAIAALNAAVEQTAQDVEAADASAQSASDSADRAEAARDTTEEYVSTVQGYAQQAQTSATNASSSAMASANSASQAQQIKTDVEGMVDEAQSAAGASAQSALESEQSASQASVSASSASQSADTASTKASEASASAQTASAKATEASEYASTASQKASESSQSASAASGYATQAGQAKTAAETAQGLAEQAQSDAESAKDDAESARDETQQIVSGISGKVEQIDQNTADIASLEADRYKAYATDTATGAVASFSDGADDIPMADVKVQIEPVQDLSHGDPSPDNICPISGWTGAQVVRTGVNVWDEEWEVGTINNTTGLPSSDANNIRAKNYCPCKPNTSYFFYSGSGKILRFYWYDAEQNCISTDTANNTIKASPDNAYYFKVRTTDNYRDTYNHNISINYPSTDTEYHPYTGDTYSITFPTEAGTIYGGTLDVTTGELTVDRAEITFDGSNDETFRSGTSGMPLRCYLPSNAKPSQARTALTGMSSNQLKEVTQSSAWGTNGTFSRIFRIPEQDYAVYFKINDAITTVTQLRDYLAESPLTFVYELATPLTYTLTASEIRTLLGQNNLWANTGDTEVEYRADTKLYIQKKIAEAISALS